MSSSESSSSSSSSSSTHQRVQPQRLLRQRRRRRRRRLSNWSMLSLSLWRRPVSNDGIHGHDDVVSSSSSDRRKKRKTATTSKTNVVSHSLTVLGTVLLMLLFTRTAIIATTTTTTATATATTATTTKSVGPFDHMQDSVDDWITYYFVSGVSSISSSSSSASSWAVWSLSNLLRQGSPLQRQRRRRMLYDSNSNNNNKKNRGLLDTDNDDDVDDDHHHRATVRYLAMGGPSTWGDGLVEPTTTAYPYLLSRNVRNVAHHYDDRPTVASLCTQSVVDGNNNNNIDDDESVVATYDVITLQFDVREEQNTSSSSSSSLPALQLLTRRLRRRFPYAALVLIDLWSPTDLVYYHHHHDDDESLPSRNSTVSFVEWRRQQADGVDLVDALARHEQSWSIMDNVDFQENEDKRVALEDIMDDVGGVVYRPPQPVDWSSQMLMDWFVEQPWMEDRDSEQVATGEQGLLYKYTLTSHAHSIIAQELESIIQTKLQLSSAHLPSLTSSDTAAAASAATAAVSAASQQLGTWGSGDSCQLWYETGKSMLPKHFSGGLKYVELSSNAQMSGQRHRQERRRRLGRPAASSSSAESSKTRRYALEVTPTTSHSSFSSSSSSSSTSGNADANLQVHNPFEEDRMVYLTYMTTAATASSKKVYPRTKVQLLPSNTAATTTTTTTSSGVVVLDPSHDDNSDVHHHTRTSAIGTVRAGQSATVYFTPLEENTESPFRIVGVSFLAKEKVTHKITSEFHLSPRGITMGDEEDKEDDDEEEVDDEGEEDDLGHVDPSAPVAATTRTNSFRR